VERDLDVAGREHRVLEDVAAQRRADALHLGGRGLGGAAAAHEGRRRTRRAERIGVDGRRGSRA
jgi:hypothetical protein